MNKIELINFTDEEDNYELMYNWCSKETIYKMIVASYITPNNIVKTEEYTEKAIDKIIEKINNVVKTPIVDEIFNFFISVTRQSGKIIKIPIPKLTQILTQISLQYVSERKVSIDG